MKRDSTMLLIGVGGAGCTMVRGILSRFGGELRHLLVDTDAASGDDGQPEFLLLGAERLSGRGTGGEIVSARLAAEDSASKLDEFLAGVRLAVVVAGLGGGTGSGATLEIVKHLATHGIVSIVMATTPFAFEGEGRHRNSRGVAAMISDAANATILVPLDHLAGGCDEMAAAMRVGLDTLAAAATMFWRLVETPGYIRLDAERLRRMVQSAGRGRFATVCTGGPGRAERAVEELVRSPTLADGTNQVRSIICGVLAGDDLRLAEIGTVADGLKTAFGGGKCDFELATVNDEQTFRGKLCVVALMFEAPAQQQTQEKEGSRSTRKRKAAEDRRRALIPNSPFSNSAPTIWNDEDLDVPTYLRQNITLEF